MSFRALSVIVLLTAAIAALVWSLESRGPSAPAEETEEEVPAEAAAGATPTDTTGATGETASKASMSSAESTRAKGATGATGAPTQSRGGEQLPLPSAARATIKDCIGVTAENLGDVVKALEKTAGGPAKQEPLWENFHITRPDGAKQRVRLSPNVTSDGKGQWQLQLFDVDREDLPIPVKIPDKDRINPTDETLRKYISEGEISMHQDSAMLRFANGVAVETVSENGVLQSFHHFGEQQLGCAVDESTGSMECDCITK